MKIFRIIAVVALFLSCSLAANAQTAAEVNATVKKMEAASAPCNKAPEAFKTFIEKFNTDQAFLDSRLAVDEAQRAKFADILKTGNFKAMTPAPKGDDEWYQSWGELQYNKAYLDCGWVDSYVEYTFEFIRNKQGLWTLAKVVAGE